MLIVISIAVLAGVWFLGRRLSVPAANGCAIVPPITAESKTPIRVGTYNIHRARGTDGKKDLSRIVNELKHSDLIGICEIQGWGNVQGENQLSLLAKKLSLAGLFCPTQKRWLRFDRGNGILSRYKIENWLRTPLVDSVGRHPRCLCQANINIEQNKVAVFVTHIARRVDQEQQLTDVLTAFNKHDRAILMGDFNVNANFPHLQKLIKESGATDALATIKNSNRIDWILVKGFKVIDAQMENSIASDHPYYWCDLEYR